jgi:cysteine desulfurase
MVFPSSIYLDNNATTHLDPHVAARLIDLASLPLANPASQHRAGRRALALLEEARTSILEAVGAPCRGMDTAQVILTSGGTEANNLALLGITRLRPGTVIVGSTEHPSVLEAAQKAVDPAHPLRLLPVDPFGRYDLKTLEHWLRDPQPISLVSLMLGNNETGVLQDLPRICQLCSAAGVPVHSDIVQAFGKIPFDMSTLGLSALTITAHKVHGPVGIGALVALRDTLLEPMVIGGGQQLGMRAGTEPVMLAVALAAALKEIELARQSGVYDAVARLRDRFEQSLCALGDVVVISSNTPRLPHTSNLAFLGLERQALHMALDLAGVACSAGSACSSGSSRPSPVLLAMGLPEDIVNSSLRFSLSKFTNDEEIDAAIEIVTRVVRKLRPKVASVSR